jgi:hypothetical protein
MAKQVRYVVQFDVRNARWDVLRNGQETSAFSDDMDTAIGAASAIASKETIPADVEATVWLTLKGKQKKVWPI